MTLQIHESVRGEQPSGGQVAAGISTAVVHALGEYTGRGPTTARTYIHRDVITVLLEDPLTKAERRLASDGSAPAVLQTRPVFGEMMRRELVDSVEDLTGRTVAAFTSADHLHPDIGIETFVLEPLPGVVPVHDPSSIGFD